MCRVDVEQLMRAELRFLSPLVSEAMFERLRKRIGWNVIVTAINKRFPRESAGSKFLAHSIENIS